MTANAELSWVGGNEVEHLQMVRRCEVKDLCDLARTYDWGLYPEAVLGWVIAQKGIDLATVLSAFVNGDPMRFNYLGKRDVPAAHRGVCRLLDNIVLRVNSGFYLPDPAMELAQAKLMRTWMRYQMEDAKAGRVGRWVFDVDMVAPTLVAAAEKQIKATSGEGLERRKDVMFERLRNTLRRVRPSEEAEHVLTS